MVPDDGRMTETCCGSNIRGGGEELLPWRTINWLKNIIWSQGLGWNQLQLHIPGTTEYFPESKKKKTPVVFPKTLERTE
jgi:hypothetical protein